MDVQDRDFVKRRFISLRIQLREGDQFGRDYDFYIDAFIRIAANAKIAASELERRKLQLRMEVE